MSLRTSTLACMLATGCIFGGGGDEPRSGEWETGESSVDVNACDLELDTLEIEIPTGFNLYRQLDGTYDLARLEEDPDKIDCEILLDQITCESESYEVPFGPTLLDVRTRMTAVVKGAKKLEMTLNVDVDCVGGNGSTGCKVAKNKAKVDDWPCELTVLFDADWVSDDLGPLDPMFGR